MIVIIIHSPLLIINYLKYSIGLDIGSKEFHVCVSLLQASQKVVVKGTRKFDNSDAGFELFSQWEKRHLKEDLPVSYTLEATGVYHERLCYWLHERGSRVSVILPTLSKRYAQSLGSYSKNDKADAKVLAQLGAERNLEKWEPFCPSMSQLRQLTRQYERIQHLKTVTSNQLHAQNSGKEHHKMVENQLQLLTNTFESQLKELNKAIESVVLSDKQLCQKWKNIEPIKGVGVLTFATIVAETNGFKLFKNERQLASFVGYDVVENQSGNHRGKTKISKKGNSRVRRMLHFPALTAVKIEDSTFANLYTRIFERTKIKMKAYTAVQRKLLATIFHIWNKNEPFDNEYYKKLVQPKKEVVVQAS